MPLGRRKYVALGAIEPQFYAALRRVTGLADDPAFDDQHDPALWPHLSERLADIFRTRTRDEWCAVMAGSEICFAPVLDLAEAPRHDHNVARRTFAQVGGIDQPMPAPRFSETAPDDPVMARGNGSDSDAILAELGYSEDRIAELRDQRSVA